MTSKRGTRERTPQDDLTVIKGIKESRQHLLRSKLAVHTYDDLAQASAEVILGAFKAEGQPITLDSVRGWIAEAARLASTRAAHKRESARAAAQDSQWQTLGLFFIEFQAQRDPTRGPIYRTKIHNYKRDIDHVLDGVAAGTVWAYLRQELEQDAPHLAALLHEEARAQPAAMTAEPVLPPPTPPETRLHDVLAELETLIHGETQPRAMLSEQPPSAPTPQVSDNGIDLTHARLQYYLDKYEQREVAMNPQTPPEAPTDRLTRLRQYLEKYGDGTTPVLVAAVPALEQPGDNDASSDEEQPKMADEKLQSYLAKYGQV
jgi:hypothetical protein